MTVEMVRDVLFWCSIINTALLILSFAMVSLAHDWIYRLHGKWYGLPPEKIGVMIYGSLGFYKICIICFNIVPYFALRIAG